MKWEDLHKIVAVALAYSNSVILIEFTCHLFYLIVISGAADELIFLEPC